ncbi:A24 family peptidase [Rhizobium sp. BK068]|uniref:prepilin peptidase n=1 Tax=Rhizobium sp. BK068 TaxID=2512130 RepID=UPI00105347B2|nr:A24 family peptidase [Rhizobium sp. BK068]TCM76252.1 leader peptidase (prepilin peptidase)/N-methyltransferase [Rhizobium sp. BK068]
MTDLAAVALVTLAALAIGWTTLPLPRALLAAALAAMMASVTIEDWRNFRVRDSMNIALAAVGIAAFLLGIDPLGPDSVRTFLAVIIDAALTGGALLLVREAYFKLRGREGLGLGDVKLAAAAGVWVGWQQFALIVFLATLAAFVYVAAATVRGPGQWPASARIPFGTFLAPAIWLVWYLAQWHVLLA